MATLQQLPTNFLELALVTNPGVQSFPWGINGNTSIIPPTDVTRAEILAELANRVAALKVAGQTFSNAIYDFGSPIGSNSLNPALGGANPCQNLNQVA